MISIMCYGVLGLYALIPVLQLLHEALVVGSSQKQPQLLEVYQTKEKMLMDFYIVVFL